MYQLVLHVFAVFGVAAFGALVVFLVLALRAPELNEFKQRRRR